MTWIQRGNSHLSAPYRVVMSVRGFEAWVFSRRHSGVLGREIKTLNQAKALCEKHKAAQP